MRTSAGFAEYWRVETQRAVQALRRIQRAAKGSMGSGGAAEVPAIPLSGGYRLQRAKPVSGQAEMAAS